MTSCLGGRTALVTGAATGIGRATAELLARRGARVICFGLGGAVLEETASLIGGLAVHGDVTSATDIAHAVDGCGGRLDIVINAAGLIVPDEPLTVSDDVWARTLDVNLTGTMRVCRAVLPLLRRRGGAIVNVVSVAAFNSSPQSNAQGVSEEGSLPANRTLRVNVAGNAEQNDTGKQIGRAKGLRHLRQRLRMDLGLPHSPVRDERTASTPFS